MSEELNPQLQEMERALAALKPARPTFAPQAIWTKSIAEAQRASRSARQNARLWRGIAGALAASLLGVAVVHLANPPRNPIVHTDPRDAKLPQTAASLSPAEALDEPRSMDYLILRQKVLSDGLTALPATSLTVHARPIRAFETNVEGI